MKSEKLVPAPGCVESTGSELGSFLNCKPQVSASGVVYTKTYIMRVITSVFKPDTDPWTIAVDKEFELVARLSSHSSSTVEIA